MSKSIDAEISYLSKKINKNNKEIIRLKSKKENLEKLKMAFPEAEYSFGAIITKDVNDKISCMKFSSEWHTLCVSFSIGPKQYGRPIYADPYKIKIASLDYNYDITKKSRSGTIKIFDYETIIDDSCSRKKKFINRIKMHILKKINKGNLLISDDSFNKDMFKKLITFS